MPNVSMPRDSSRVLVSSAGARRELVVPFIVGGSGVKCRTGLGLC